jgi:hypothetical protein
LGYVEGLARKNCQRNKIIPISKRDIAFPRKRKIKKKGRGVRGKK